MTKEEFLAMWVEELEDCVTTYKEAMQQKPYAKEDHDHILRDRLGSRLYLYGDELPKDEQERVALKKDSVAMMLEKARQLGIEIPFDEMASYIRLDPKNIKYIDVLTTRADKDDLLTMMASENPEVLSLLSEEEFDSIRRGYEDSIVKFNEMSQNDPNRHLLSRDHQKYVDGHPNYVVQLIKNNTELANNPMIKSIVKREPALRDDIITIFEKKKEEIGSELEAARDELERYKEENDREF